MIQKAGLFRKASVLLGAGALAWMALAPSVHAQSPAYPDKPVRWVVPFPAGGGLDSVSRVVAAEMAALLGQPVVVDNRVGAGGTIGAASVASSPADGYTLMSLDSGSYTTSHLFYTKLNYNAVRDFKLVGTMVRLPVVLAVPANSPLKTYQDFVAFAKANPGKGNYASPGLGTPQHTGMELLQSRTGLKLQHIPYKAMSAILTDLSTGQVDVAFSDYGSAKSFLDGGRIRLLAVATERRLPVQPNVPTFDELGVKSLPVSMWHSFVVPGKTPDAVVERLSTVLNTALQSPKMKAQVDASSSQVFFKNGREGAAYVNEQAAMWAPIVKGLNIQLD